MRGRAGAPQDLLIADRRRAAGAGPAAAGPGAEADLRPVVIAALVAGLLAVFAASASWQLVLISGLALHLLLAS